MTLPVDYANATVSLDNHPDAHNATNAAVNELDTRVGDLEAVDTFTLLTGAGTPSTGTGADGDYYLDTTNKILYGPKGNPTYGTAQRIACSGTVSHNTGGQNYAIGLTFAQGGRITKIRYHRLADPTCDATLTFQIWNAAGTKLYEQTDTQTASGFFEFTLSTPVPVTAAETLRFSIYGPTFGAQKQPVPTVTPTADVTFVSWWTSTGGSGAVFPTIDPVTRGVIVEPSFEPFATAPWPVAIYGIPAGGTTGQFLKKSSGADFAVAWVT